MRASQVQACYACFRNPIQPTWTNASKWGITRWRVIGRIDSIDGRNALHIVECFPSFDLDYCQEGIVSLVEVFG